MQAGFGKSIINFILGSKGTPLMGYASLDQRAIQKESELFVRCVLLVGEKNNPVFSVCMEVCFASYQLKHDIVKYFERKDYAYKPIFSNLMLHAQNTHSAPGGYSSYLLHNLLSGGFNKNFYNALLEASIKAIEKSINSVNSAKIILNVSEIDEEKNLAFNRNLAAYNANKDVSLLSDNQTHLALNRWVKQLKIIDKNGAEKGIINWFGVHGNSVGPEKRLVSSDNKGYAASIFEKEMAENQGFVAIFAQEAAGDISPNYHGNALRWPRGKYEDSFKSAYFNGFLQYEKAVELCKQTEVDIPIIGTIKADSAFYDFSNLTLNEKYSDSGELSLGQASLGLSVIKGLDIDSKGVNAFTANLIAGWIKLNAFFNEAPLISSRKKRLRMKKLRRIQGNKEILIELEQKKIAGFKRLNNIPLADPFSDLLSIFKKAYQKRVTHKVDWWPSIIELQYIQIGSLLIIGIPGDITSQAAVRLKQAVMDASEHQFLDVIINSYANDYCGYICTPEEYDKQYYEGGFTVFGRETLGAFQTAYTELIKGSKQSALKTKRPKALSSEELEQMIF